MQNAVFDAIAAQVFDLDGTDPVEALSADEVLAIRPPVDVRAMAVSLMAVLEFVAHPLRPRPPTGSPPTPTGWAWTRPP